MQPQRPQQTRTTPGFTDSSYDLFKLPPELRHRVYKILVGVVNDKDPVNVLGVNTANEIWRRQLSSQFLRVNKFIHKEFSALLYGLVEVRANGFDELARLLNTIGDNARSSVRDIVLIFKSLPHPMIHPKKREVIFLDRESKPPGRYGFMKLPSSLPVLKGVKSITVQYELIDDMRWKAIHDGEQFVHNLVWTTPTSDHFLSKFMALFRGCSEAEWRIKIISQFFVGQPFLQDWTKAKQTLLKMHMSVKEVMVNKNGKAARCWQFRDEEQNGRADEAISVWSCEPHSLDPAQREYRHCRGIGC